MLPFKATQKQQFGATIEEWVLDQLIAQGYQARLISRWGATGDLVIDDSTPVTVEVKAARRRMRKVRPGYYAPEWRWHVANLDQSRDHLLALVAEDSGGQRFLYLVPSWEAFGRQGLSITNHPYWYKGRLAKYRDAWGSIATVAEKRQKFNKVQLSFEGV